MATYTIELNKLLQTNFPLPLNLYPIWDEAYRPVLNQKIIDRYYFREIGAETPDRWAHYLKSKMNEIMPYYNDLYKTTQLEFNPLYTTDLKESFERQQADTAAATSTNNRTDDTTSESGSTGIMSNTATGTVETDVTQTNTTTEGQRDDKAIKSDTPQGNISIATVDVGGFASEVDVDRKGEQVNSSSGTDIGTTTSDQQSDSTTTTTATGTGKLTSVGTGETTATANTTEDYIKIIAGYTSNPSAALKMYRQNLLNIDIMIVEELNSLFMGVY